MMIFQNRDREDEKKNGNEESKTRKNEERREKMEERERERDMCVNECVRRTDRVEDQSF